MHISVLVPTLRRVMDLERCLEALACQERIPDEVVVVVRNTDEESQQLLNRWRDRPFLRVVEVEESGQVQALNAGLNAVAGEIVMITDDDAKPHSDWCRRVEAHFRNNAGLGGVGGRDIVHNLQGRLDDHCTVTGRVQPWGRLVGNHHLIAPAVTPVDFLKGANMSYRLTAVGDLRFDTRLRGAGAQVGNDMAFSMAIAKRGWGLLYDPAIQVDHFPAPRQDNDKRGERNLLAIKNRAFNTWWTLSHHLRPGARRTLALLWEDVIGTAHRPGRLRGWVAHARRNPVAIETSVVVQEARSDARMLSRKG